MNLSVREVKKKIDSAEFTNWIAYFNLHPPIGDRIDWGFMLSNYYFASANSDPKGRRPEPSDFLPPWKKEKKEINVDALQTKFRAIATSINERVNARTKKKSNK